MLFGRSSITIFLDTIKQNRVAARIRTLPYWVLIGSSNLIVSLATRISHEPDRLKGEYSHVDPYLYTAYINNFRDMTDRFGDGWYYNSRISGIFPEAILRFIFGNTLGSHLTIFFGLCLLSTSLILIYRRLEIAPSNLFSTNLVLTLSPLLLYEFGQDYPSLWSNVWGILGLGLLVNSRYKSFLAAGFFMSLAINAWEGYFSITIILVASYYFALPTRIKLRTKIHSITLIICGGALSQMFLSLCMFVYRGLDVKSVLFQKTTWNWIVSFYNLETTVYDVKWNVLGTKTVVIILLSLPLFLLFFTLVDHYQNNKLQFSFISRLAINSTFLTSAYVAYQMLFNANISIAALYYLSPLVYPAFLLSLLSLQSNLQNIEIRRIALVFICVNALNFNPFLELLISGGYLLSDKLIRKNLVTKSTQISSLSIVTILLLGLAPTLDVKKTSENFSTCILTLNCSKSDSKLRVANDFQDWYISEYKENEQFYIYTIPETDLDEDLVFRVIATGVFSFTYLPNLEGNEFVKLTYLEFERYFSVRKNVVLLSGTSNSLDSIRNGFLTRDSRFKVSPVHEIKNRDVKIYVARIGI